MASRNLNATVEDVVDDDDHQAPPEALRRSPAANVGSKRSHPSDLGSEKPAVEKVVNADLPSDSEYSSHTAATVSSSADSGISAKASSPSTAPSSAASYQPSSPATTKRRPTLVTEDRKSSSQSSPRKPLQRTGSLASKRPPPASRRSQQPEEECTDPNCTTCGPNAIPARGRRPQGSPSEPARDVSYASYDQRSQRSDPAPFTTSPPSPTYTRQRQPAPYAHGSAVVQPAQTRRSSSTARRPMSYHEGQQYWAPGMPAPYPSPPQEHGPPPAMSAHYNMHHPQQVPAYPMGMMQPSGFYGHPQPMAQTSPPYEQQRPPLSARGSATSQTYQTRPPARPQSGFGPALVTYEQPMPSARFHDAPPSARQDAFPSAPFESESSDYSSSEDEQTRHRALMPAPKLKSSKKNERRPELRHAKTTQVYNDERRQSMAGLSKSVTLPERPRERDPRASRVSTTATSRATSRSRPALVQHKAQSAYDAPRPSKVVVENPQSQRRQSYAYEAYEQANNYDRDYLVEQKERNRKVKAYRDERSDRRYHDGGVAVSERPRRRADTAVSVGRRDSYAEPPKERRAAMDAEAYQQRTRGTNDPLVDTVHKAAKRASRVPSGPSDAGSSRSGDRKTRVSQSARTTVTNGGGGGEIRLRVDASAPLSLQFAGDMEGRTLQINPAEGGMADIVIGSSRGEENTYRSERGSTVGNRKSLVAGGARREIEEASVRSSRSSQGRREREREQEQRRPLRRRQTEYN